MITLREIFIHINLVQLPTTSPGMIDHGGRIHYRFGLFLLFCVFIISSGCDQTFQPLQENDKYFFSMFGYLDASADTQWVRVSPARQQLNLPPEIPDMLVTLEHLETGKTVVMKDSLFGGGSGFNYINYYTSMNIEPGQTYLLKAEQPDGKSSHVALSTPEDFPTPLFHLDTGIGNPLQLRNYQIIMSGTDNIADVQTWWFIRIHSDDGVVDKKFTITYADRLYWVTAYDDAYIVDFVYEEEVQAIMNSPIIRLSPDAEVEVLHRQVYVARGGPEWNQEIRSLNDLIYAQLDVTTNVENGLGYMVGIYSKVIPYDTCRSESGWLIACEEEEPFCSLGKTGDGRWQM
jgi:hypothetical protein